MPVFLEFLLIAFLIYLWEAILWLPKQGNALRRNFSGKSWKVTPATRFLATRELGLVPLLPFLPDFTFVPTQGFPLVVSSDGKIFSEDSDGNFQPCSAEKWEDFHFDSGRLHAGEKSIRSQSPRVAETLSEGRKLGLTPQQAILRAWKLAVSPARARHEITRWKIANLSLRLYCPLLTFAFFIGLPATYFFAPPLAILWIALWLWILMIVISMHLFWIARKIYPSARAQLRQDAFLAALIPFHAMRALEVASVHAFARTHPAGILHPQHNWMKSFSRKLLHPRPGLEGDLAFSHTVTPALVRSMSIDAEGFQKTFDEEPDCSEDPEAGAYCPRCHGIFLANVTSCVDCRSIPLRKFRP